MSKIKFDKDDTFRKRFCPQCASSLHKRKKGQSDKVEPLAIGVSACHNCESVFLISQLTEPKEHSTVIGKLEEEIRRLNDELHFHLTSE